MSTNSATVFFGPSLVYVLYGICPEVDVALKTRIAPETCAARKREMQAERDAWDAKVEAVGAAVTEHLKYAVRRPDAEELAQQAEPSARPRVASVDTSRGS